MSTQTLKKDKSTAAGLLAERRLAVFLPDLSGGGAERSLLNLACGFAELGHQVDLVLANAQGPYLSQVPNNVRLVDLHSPIPRKSIGKLARYLRTERPKVVLSALDNANVIALLARRLARVDTRVVISIRNHLSVDYKNARELRFQVHKLCVRLFYSWADAIVSVSAGVADDLAEMIGMPRQKIDVVYNPVVSAEMLAKATQPVDHPWLAAGALPVVLAVGRLAPQKDHANLLQAFAKVRRQIPCRLMILGEGDERPNLEAKIAELGLTDDVALPGFAENPFAYMSKAAVFVLSSQFEGLPGVLIQAMACGAPVVSTDCPSGPREVLRGGEYGALVPVGDSDALAAAISNVLSGNRMAAPPESLDPFRSEASVCEYLKILLR